MAEIDNENQDGGQSDGDRAFGEIEERTDDQGDGSEAAESEEKSEDNSEEGSDQGEEGDGSEGKTEDADAGDGKGKPELTEKGTKRDPNPQSAVHQDLANAKRSVQQMEAVLANPDLLAKFMKQQYGVDVPLAGKTEEKTEKTAPDVKKYTAADFDTLDQVAEVVNGLQERFLTTVEAQKAEIERLNGQVGTLTQGGNAQRIYATMADEVGALQKEPELDPNHSDYIEGLEKDISGMYHRLDFDEKSQSYRGQYSVAEIGRVIIDAARKARAKGSQKAQTVVKNKSEGKVRTSTQVKDDSGEANAAPGDSIAKGVAKLFG